MMRQTVDILGIPFSSMKMQETIDYISKQLYERETAFHIVTANPEIVMCAKKDPQFKESLLQADLITPDGIGVVKVSGWFGEPIPERVGGFDMMNQWLGQFTKEDAVKLYLLGAKQHVVEKAAAVLSETYPGVIISGYHNGYFRDEEEEDIIQKVQEAKPDILLVALGFPRQETFIMRNKHRMGAKVAVGVGGSFDVWAGEVKRAPKWMQAINLEWFYRLISNPTRWRRQIVLIEFLQEAIRARKKRKS
ncbi:WecB/TagA/CpsF family glycosyltransferase [Ectobacillus sp. sgz5001026]|uniref:WecB/TagA/CpsF family glycosyltransferase n=1 Tax=Ectobacillus sp. sgz5001026 TaxID=3242473 RepID=UPI0036D43D30